MAKMTLEELRKLRETQQKEINKRDVSGKQVQVIVGMGTCGIAAGAKATMSSFLNALDEENLTNVVVKQTGCMGLCYAEPTVEVIMPDMPNVIYGNVDAATAAQIVRSHIVNKQLVDNHIFDRPAGDIVKG